jgi:hypothetical protein
MGDFGATRDLKSTDRSEVWTWGICAPKRPPMKVGGGGLICGTWPAPSAKPRSPQPHWPLAGLATIRSI